MSDYKFPVFHVNEKKKIDRFVRKGDIIFSSDYGDWAGSGMYFWDNSSNADYWAKQKKKKYPNKEFLKSSATLQYDTDQLLDLTDKQRLEDIGSIFDRLSLNMDKKLNRDHSDKKVMISQKIDFIITNLLHEIVVVKVIATYKKKSDSNIIYNSTFYPSVDESAKVIYCVRESSRLSDRKIIQ